MNDSSISTIDVLNTLAESVVVIKPDGEIILVNLSWENFAVENGMPRSYKWTGTNYLDACKLAVDIGDEDAKQAYDGIQRLVNNEVEHYEFEYPCHSLNDNRWFMQYARAIRNEACECTAIVISHINITDRKKLEDKLMDYAIKDPLTNIFNRRYLELKLQEYISQNSEKESEFSLIMVDVDQFKKINDRYGHQVGDQVLIKIAENMRDSVNSGDLVARYGGDEFIICINGSGLKNIRQIVDRLTEKLRNFNLIIGERTLQIKSSIGVLPSEVTSSVKDYNELLRQVDNAMYSSKRQGMSQVTILTE